MKEIVFVILILVAFLQVSQAEEHQESLGKGFCYPNYF